jgi:hypothetical protein
MVNDFEYLAALLRNFFGLPRAAKTLKFGGRFLNLLSQRDATLSSAARGFR